MSKLQIREAIPEDAKELIDFYNLAGGESDYLLHGANEFRVSCDRVAAMIRAISNSANSIMLVGVIDGIIIARAMIEGYHSKRVCHRGKLSITVKKEYWNQGIGTQMIEKIFDLAISSLHLQILELEVLEENQSAIALYTKMGFRKFGFYENYFYLNGEYKNAVFMNCNLLSFKRS